MPKDRGNTSAKLVFAKIDFVWNPKTNFRTERLDSLKKVYIFITTITQYNIDPR